MRIAPAHRIGIASVTLLASFVGCSDPTSTPVTPADSGVDVTPTTDTPKVDAPSTDTTPTADTTPATDTPVTPADVPPVGECGGIGPEVAAHVTAMSTMGWAALNRSRSMMMHGCAGASRPQDCLAMVPEVGAADIGANRSAIPGAHLRLLYTGATRSGFWTRSSADGRFVGRGIHLYDLARSAGVTMTGAMYDPAFFPDNSGYTYQPGGRLCPMSTLTTGEPTAVQLMGAGSPCAGSSLGLYQHLGTSLDGADYWATSAGNAAWDDGGHAATLTETRRNEAWGATAQTSLTLMANSGSGFTAVGSRSVRTPYQGDAVISPSSRMLITRFVDAAGAYQGYILNRLDASHTGPAIMASATEIARYCVQGAKPGFSYDERYITYHHYAGGGPDADADARELGFTGEDDPAFAEYTRRGVSNVYILDLLTGAVRRVTNMGPGQYALYPHYRSDGWIYFIVRTLGTGREQVIASDAGFMMR